MKLHLPACVVVVCFTALSGILAGDDGERQGVPDIPLRAVVKFKPEMGRQVEGALPRPKLELTPQDSAYGSVTLFRKHGVQKIRPLYRSLVEQKKNGEKSHSERVREKFPKRAVRASQNPPEISYTYLVELKVTGAAELEKSLEKLRKEPGVEFAEVETPYFANLIPNDPYYSSRGSWGRTYDDLYGLKKMDTATAWDQTNGAGLVVAVVDTGVDYNHLDLAANIWTNSGEIAGNGVDDDANGQIDDQYGWDFIGASSSSPVSDNNPSDVYGHGTHVAGTIAATGQNGLGVIGVAYGARVMAVKGLADNGTGTNSTVANAIIYAVDNGADLINASWSGGYSQTVRDAVDYAHSLGVVFVAAAGNDNRDVKDSYPASYANVISITATDHTDARASFSNWGDRIDVAAPGVDILSLRAAGATNGTVVATNYSRMSGTSMATPHACGLAALILALHPEFSVEQVRQVLRVSATDTGTPGVDLYTGYGRVHAGNALQVSSALESRIQSPDSGYQTTDSTVIRGVAQGPDFASYTLEYGIGDSPGSWTVIHGSTTPVAGGELGTFDSRFVADGNVTIRLRVFSAGGQLFEDRIKMLINHYWISSPAPLSNPSLASAFKPGVTVSINGLATAADFQSFRLEWARGWNATTGWSSTGVALTGNGASPASGKLGDWFTPSGADADFYTIRLTLVTNSWSSSETTVVYLEPDLLSSNWPRSITYAPTTFGGILPQLNGTGDTTLRVMSWSGGATLWGFSPNGAQVTTSTGLQAYRKMPIGLLDATAGEELIVSDLSQFRVLQSNNSAYSIPFPSFPANDVNSFKSITLLEDLDGNGQAELVFVRSYQGTAYLYAWKSSGQLLTSNYPVTYPDSSWLGFPANRILAVDLDHDGRKEILACQMATGTAPTFSIVAFNWDGTPRPWPAQSYYGILNQMAVTDFDHDGTPDILFIYYNYSNGLATVWVFDSVGQPRTGWPVTVSTGFADGALALGDLNRDGFDEVIATGAGGLHVLNRNGTVYSAGWPKSGQHSPAVLGDVNNDGFPDIICLSENYSAGTYYLNAYDAGGTLLKRWQMFGMGIETPSTNGTPAIGDFDRDGSVDIAVTYQTMLNGATSRGLVSVLDTGSPFNESTFDWPMLLHDGRSSASRIPPDRTAPTVSITTPSNNAALSGTVTINAAATDNLLVAGVQFYVDGTALGAEDTSAPYSATWDTVNVIGPHVISAIARDSAGNTAASAPVTIRLLNTVKINFQPAGAPVPAGYLVDSGSTYGARGNGCSYGWNAVNTANVVDRNSSRSADQRYDTLAMMQTGGAFSWEMAVPAGSYNVRIVAGDPDAFNSSLRISAEGILIINGNTKNNSRWIDATGIVNVGDGRLNVTNAAGAQNNKICFIEITGR